MYIVENTFSGRVEVCKTAVSAMDHLLKHDDYDYYIEEEEGGFYRLMVSTHSRNSSLFGEFAPTVLSVVADDPAEALLKMAREFVSSDVFNNGRPLFIQQASAWIEDRRTYNKDNEISDADDEILQEVLEAVEESVYMHALYPITPYSYFSRIT